MRPDPSWSPHPMAAPGRHLAGLLQLAVGVVILVLVREGRLIPAGLLGEAATGFLLVIVLAAGLLPRGRRVGRFLWFLAVVAAAVAAQFAVFRLAAPEPGMVPGAVLVAAGFVTLFVAERRRRRVRFRLESDRLVLRARRWQIEHSLPLAAVREIDARRSVAGRLWGYGTLVGRARKGTMKNHMTRPVVSEPPPEDALGDSGWDDGERFRVVAAHPYRRLARLLEARVRISRLGPEERRERELAARLAADLEGMEV